MIFSVIKADSSLLKLAHQLVEDRVKTGDIVIDATVGNGHDTAFLLDKIKPDGKVLGFDIQKAALDATKGLLNRHPASNCLSLIHASHADMEGLIPQDYIGKIKAVVFNLGYLPGGDKRIITRTGSTLSALDTACRLLSANGVISVMAYPGHNGGHEETDEVEAWCLNLNTTLFKCTRYENRPDNPNAPKLYFVHNIAHPND